MKILQTITVNQVLTVTSKNQLLEKYKKQYSQLQKEIDQLKFEMKKLEKTKKFQPTTLKKHFEKEISNRSEKIKLLDFQMEQLDILPIGSELKERDVQAIIDVEIGTDWDELMKTKTIVVTDGKVTEIR
ncbi:YlqD family protein [Bacillus massiliigorillae]|uniref:YlqD family protein n=1 Tax=Bacillus massiliigorillae TaxID=1243664 RepID=UPI0003A6C9CE|nr:YlqD family protein [Bacillus massiliigorillae]